MWKEFKQMIFRGNILDMAVGVMIGAAFGNIVSSLVNDIFMPIINSITGKVNVSAMSVTIGEATLTYGAFIQAIIDFLLMAICVFIFVKIANTVRKNLEKPAKVEEEKPKRVCPYCKSEIADDATRCPHCTSQLSN